MIFGLSFFGTTWIIISIILGVILLLLLGIFYDEKEDGDGFIVLKATVAIMVSILWPIVLIISVCVGVVAIPIYLGKKIRNFITQRKEKKIEKENFFKQLEETNFYIKIANITNKKGG